MILQSRRSTFENGLQEFDPEFYISLNENIDSCSWYITLFKYVENELR